MSRFAKCFSNVIFGKIVLKYCFITIASQHVGHRMKSSVSGVKTIISCNHITFSCKCITCPLKHINPYLGVLILTLFGDIQNLICLKRVSR